MVAFGVVAGTALANEKSSAAQATDHGNSANAPGQVKKDDGGSSSEAGSDASGSGSEASSASSSSNSDPGNPNAGCNQTPYSSADGNGANHSGPYDDTCVPAPSGNGNGGGNAVGKPCAGCVGNADEKNPKGQYPGGGGSHYAGDNNNGYECDGNHGIARTNPAHTGCTTPPPPNNDCVPTPANNQCQPRCVPSAANNQCQPPCQPSPANHECGENPGNPCESAASEVTCTQVLGETFTAGPKPTAVLGEKLVRVAGETLPRTGLDVQDSLMLALTLMLVGALMLALDRKRSEAARIQV
jgi:LPXTG-motif cell wall-anchored protein